MGLLEEFAKQQITPEPKESEEQMLLKEMLAEKRKQKEEADKQAMFNNKVKQIRIDKPEIDAFVKEHGKEFFEINAELVLLAGKDDFGQHLTRKAEHFLATKKAEKESLELKSKVEELTKASVANPARVDTLHNSGSSTADIPSEGNLDLRNRNDIEKLKALGVDPGKLAMAVSLSNAMGMKTKTKFMES